MNIEYTSDTTLTFRVHLWIDRSTDGATNVEEETDAASYSICRKAATQKPISAACLSST